MVTSSPGGISCPSDCSQSFTDGTRVTLSADPDSRSTFGGWSGDCSGTGACTLTMNGSRSVTARFDLPSQYTLSVSTTGHGTVVSTPFGIDCGSGGNSCSKSFDRGSTVGLTAIPDLGSLFDHWTGACSGGSLGCSVTMSEPQSVGAVFQGLEEGDPARAARALR